MKREREREREREGGREGETEMRISCTSRPKTMAAHSLSSVNNPTVRTAFRILFIYLFIGIGIPHSGLCQRNASSQEASLSAWTGGGGNDARALHGKPFILRRLRVDDPAVGGGVPGEGIHVRARSLLGRLPGPPR